MMDLSGLPPEMYIAFFIGMAVGIPSGVVIYESIQMYRSYKIHKQLMEDTCVEKLREQVNNMTEKKDDMVKAPSHYCEGRKYEPWDVSVDWGLDKDAFLFNAHKYIARAGRKLYPGKNAQESKIIDLEKAITYLQKDIEVEKATCSKMEQVEKRYSGECDDMSGGALDRLYVIKEWAREIDNENPLLSKMLWDLYHLLDRYDYYICGDIGEEDIASEWMKFCRKWMDSDPHLREEIIMEKCKAVVDSSLRGYMGRGDDW